MLRNTQINNYNLYQNIKPTEKPLSATRSSRYTKIMHYIKDKTDSRNCHKVVTEIKTDPNKSMFSLVRWLST